MDLSRRDFLKGSARLVGGAALLTLPLFLLEGCSTTAAEQLPEVTLYDALTGTDQDVTTLLTSAGSVPLTAPFGFASAYRIGAKGTDPVLSGQTREGATLENLVYSDPSVARVRLAWTNPTRAGTPIADITAEETGASRGASYVFLARAPAAGSRVDAGQGEYVATGSAGRSLTDAASRSDARDAIAAYVGTTLQSSGRVGGIVDSTGAVSGYVAIAGPSDVTGLIDGAVSSYGALQDASVVPFLYNGGPDMIVGFRLDLGDSAHYVWMQEGSMPAPDAASLATASSKALFPDATKVFSYE